MFGNIFNKSKTSIASEVSLFPQVKIDFIKYFGLRQKQIILSNISDIGEEIKSYEKVRGHRMAKAGLEAALWDLFAKSKNISLSKMMGGTRKC